MLLTESFTNRWSMSFRYLIPKVQPLFFKQTTMKPKKLKNQQKKKKVLVDYRLFCCTENKCDQVVLSGELPSPNYASAHKQFSKQTCFFTPVALISFCSSRRPQSQKDETEISCTVCFEKVSQAPYLLWGVGIHLQDIKPNTHRQTGSTRQCEHRHPYLMQSKPEMAKNPPECKTGDLLPLDAGTKDLPNVEPAGSRRKEQTERTEVGARPEESRAFQGAGTGVRGRTGESAAGASTPQREHPPGSQPRQNNLAPLRSRAQLVPVARLEPDAEKQEGFDTGTRRADPSHTPPPAAAAAKLAQERDTFHLEDPRRLGSALRGPASSTAHVTRR